MEISTNEGRKQTTTDDIYNDTTKYIPTEEINSHIKIILKTTPIILLYEQLSYNAPRDTEMGQLIQMANEKDI